MSPLVRFALEILQDPTAGSGVKVVAISTILSALEQGVEVAPGSHVAVWRHLLASDGSAVYLHRQELIHEEVARDAVRVLLDGDSGEGASDLAVAVLKGDNVRVVSDEDLVSIAGRMLDEAKVRRLAWLVERIHEERGLSHEFIIALRDQLAGSEVPAVRVGAVEIAALVPRLDEAFVARMLNDAAPPVRSAVADFFEKVDVLDKPLALVIVRRQLELEHHRTVLSGLHYCMGSLVRASGRRVRQWEPPTGGAEN